LKNLLKIDRRIIALVLTVAAILAIRFIIVSVPSSVKETVTVSPGADIAGEREKHAATRTNDEVYRRFKQGVAMLHAKRYEHAVTALQRVLELSPGMPEAYVNMGFAMIGLEKYETAREQFKRAIAINAEQVNAYYGLAVALEGLNDLMGAIGAMESYVHLTTKDDPFKPRAQAALWEWRAAVKEKKEASKRTESGNGNDGGEKKAD
jgi:tetratricopeptide (TPR) repeat protein